MKLLEIQVGEMRMMQEQGVPILGAGGGGPAGKAKITP